MDNSLLIGKYIYRFLSTNQTLLDKVDAENIFPLLANLKLDGQGQPTDVTFPFVTFERTKVRPIYTKWLEVADNEIEVVVSCVTPDYDESIEIINIVRNIFESKRYEDEDISISNIMVQDVSEDYDLNTFIQHITFKMNVRTK
jgi:hypothetical protein